MIFHATLKAFASRPAGSSARGPSPEGAPSQLAPVERRAGFNMQPSLFTVVQLV